MISSSYPHFSALWNRECLKRAVSTSSPICPSKHFNLVLIQPSTETVKTPMTSTLTEQMDTFQFFFSGSTSRIGHIWLFSLSSCALFFLFLWHLSFVFPLFFFCLFLLRTLCSFFSNYSPDPSQLWLPVQEARLSWRCCIHKVIHALHSFFGFIWGVEGPWFL